MCSKRLLFKLDISYRGDKFFGFQQQEKSVAVINKILDAYNAVFNMSCSIDICGRTDKGVSGVAMPILLATTRRIDSHELMQALNQRLGAHIEVLHCFRVFSDTFDIKKNVFAREYEYLVSKQPVSLFLKPYVNHVPEFDVSEAKRAASLFEGRHSFENFANNNGVEQKTWVRALFKAAIAEVDNVSTFKMDKSNIYCLSVVGQGYLYNMVRNILGAIIECCKRPELKSEVEKYLSKETDKARSRFYKTESATGLYFKKASYLYY